eukprot:7460173-Pyramimonas_sp.AAC.1
MSTYGVAPDCTRKARAASCSPVASSSSAGPSPSLWLVFHFWMRPRRAAASIGSISVSSAWSMTVDSLIFRPLRGAAVAAPPGEAPP